jgi:protein-S-isoprenylcysteine O-methyltransferase Ste14
MVLMPERVPTGEPSSGRRSLLLAVGVDLVGAVVVLLFGRATVRYYLETHRLIGAVFIVQQVAVAVAFLVRRRASSVSGRPLDWAIALGGSFGGFLLRPGGLEVGSDLGLMLQVAGLICWTLAFVTLGRSFGLVAADRGVVTRGPYRLVRHPLYASYMVTQLGYLFQSASAWNLAVLGLVWSCQAARSVAEERLLTTTRPYQEYRSLVRWRLIPGIW